MELPRKPGKWVNVAAAVAALAITAAWQPAAAQEKPAQQSDEPAAPQQAEKIMKSGPDQGGQDDSTARPGVVPTKRPIARPPARGSKVRRPQDTPQPTVQLKPGEVPGIKFDTPVYDFGRVKAGTEITHDFWFTNTGTGPLEILRAKPS